MKVTRYDSEQKTFYVQRHGGVSELQAVHCNIKLQGFNSGAPAAVDTSQPLSNYAIFRFANPYLNAQNDVFKIQYGDKSIGFIIPFQAIEDNDDDSFEEFDEYKQAYKYYCASSILEETDFENASIRQEVNFAELVDKNAIFVVIYKPQITDTDFKIHNCLPSLALRGYYYFPEHVNANVLNLVQDAGVDAELENLIHARFYSFRSQKSMTIAPAGMIIEQHPLMKLLYEKLLIGSGNALQRFLILYQVIEFFVDANIRSDIAKILPEKDSLSNYKFIQRINELNNTRSAINKMFNLVSFDEKTEITNALRSFILEFDSDFNSNAAGDCFYDIRNLLFHDFKSVLAKNKDGAITGLVIQCEILIHQLLIGIGRQNQELVRETLESSTSGVPKLESLM